MSPEDANHLAEVQRILTRLQFQAHGDRYDCTPGDLIRLGKRADPSINDDRTALAHGATKFKVNFDQLRTVYGESDWAKKNILIAVAGSETDGTSGVREAADATIREEIEKFSHVIFASVSTEVTRTIRFQLVGQLKTVSRGSRVGSLLMHFVRLVSIRLGGPLSGQNRRSTRCRRK